MNEADTCRKYVLPKLYAAAWTDEQINEQRTFTDGRIVVAGKRTIAPPAEASRLPPPLPAAIFPSPSLKPRPHYKNPGDGLAAGERVRANPRPQVRLCHERPRHRRARFPDRPGNGSRQLPALPMNSGSGYKHGGKHLRCQIVERLLAPYYHLSGKSPRYYQEIAINRAVQAILQGKKRVLLTLGDRHRQDRCGLPDLLEAVELALEPHRRVSPPAHSLSRRPQHPRRRPEGQDLRAIR